MSTEMATMVTVGRARRWAIAVGACAMLAATGCGKKKGGGDDTRDWSQAPVVSVTDTANGLAFSIDVPQGMERKAFGQSEVRWAAKGERGPSFSIDKTPMRVTAEVADGIAGSPAGETAAKREIEGGHVVVRKSSYGKDNNHVRVHLFRNVGTDAALHCIGFVNRSAPVAQAEIDWLEKVCLTLAAK